MTDTLFLYCSRDGQTKRICEAMAATMLDSGKSCRLLEIAAPEATAALAECRQIIIGAPIYFGHLPRALYRFIAAHTTLLATRPNAFFCVSASARKPGRDCVETSAYLRRFLNRSPWWPQRLTAFAGTIAYPRYRWHERAIIRLIMHLSGGPTDTQREHELTDWDAVRRIANDWTSRPEVCRRTACASCATLCSTPENCPSPQLTPDSNEIDEQRQQSD